MAPCRADTCYAIDGICNKESISGRTGPCRGTRSIGEVPNNAVDSYLLQAIGARRFTGGADEPPAAGVPDIGGDIDMDMDEEAAFGEGVSWKAGDRLMASGWDGGQMDIRLLT